jgi:hypothetical protein
VDQIHSYKKCQYAKTARKVEAKNYAVYHALNFTFLIIGVTGWLFLLVGVLAGFLGGGEAIESS